jgi:DNA-binding LacI/PurR family transcriptional regulator
MQPFHSLSVAEQLVAHIRQSISSGELSGNMPGIRKMANTLGVSSNTVVAAIEQLEREGFLQPQGHGRRSRIVLPNHFPRPAFRVTLLPYERADTHLDYILDIQRGLKEEGHDIHIADKSLVDMRMDLSRISRLVSRTETDAWVVLSAPQDVLQCFVDLSLPTFALFGRFRKLPIAGIGLDKVPAFRAAVRRLAELGHRRIVLLQPKHNRHPEPALLVRESMEEMEAQGIETGPYNIPDWEQSPTGLRKRLDSLFTVSPPTAIILDRPNELIGAQHYLARRGILAPQDISLVADYDPSFDWLEPSISCIKWHSHPWVSRVVHWVNNVAKGKDDRRQSFTKAEFVERDSIGPAPTAKSPAKL